MTASTTPQPSINDAAANGVLRLALQRAEPRRLALILVLLALAVALNLLRHFEHDKALQGQTFYLRLGLLAFMAAYALGLMMYVRHANRQARQVHGAVWLAATLIEALFPTLALLAVETSGRVSPIEALAAPAIVVYGCVLILSILRVRPALSLLSGVVCAAGHGFLLFWAVRHGAQVSGGEWAYLLSYPANLLVAGIAAALVSSEVRKYFRASLREAEARRRLERVEQEVEIARTIQQGLLPDKPPHLPGFEIAGWNRPADLTGGDYYDWQTLPDGRVAVIIADVTGHGLGPALIMAVCRAYARACVPVGPELRSSLARLNAHLHGDVSAGRFVTFAAVILDPAGGACELLSAGHGPILHYRAADGQIAEYNGDGVPLGILENEDYGHPRQVSLGEGDLLLLITDGFFEWSRPSDGAQFGVERLHDCLRTNAKAAPAELIERLDAEVRAFSEGSPQSDDMTAVVIRRVASRN